MILSSFMEASQFEMAVHHKDNNAKYKYIAWCVQHSKCECFFKLLLFKKRPWILGVDRSIDVDIDKWTYPGIWGEHTIG